MKLRHLVTVLLILSLALGACATESTPPDQETGTEDSDEPVYGGTLTVAIGEQPSTLYPYGGMSDDKTLMHITEPLVVLDKDTLEPKPHLAKSWEIPDEKTYIFELRKGVKFHDGTEFDAEAVKFAFDHMLDPEVGSPRADDFSPVESVEVLGPHKVAFHLSKPFAPFLSILAVKGYIVSPKAIKNKTQAELAVAPVGTGPFEIVEWVKDDKIVLKRFDDYWDEGLPYLDKLVYKIIPDPTAKMTALRTGDVDLVDTIPAHEKEPVVEDDSLVFASKHSTGYRSIYLNCAAEPFNDPKVRQAIAWSIDRQELIDLALMGIGKPAYGPIAPPQWAFDPDFKPYERDVEKAKNLLEEAGKTNLEFTIKVANNPEEIRQVEVLQEQLNEAGITMNLQTGEYTALRSEVIEGNYDAFYVGWLGGPDPDSNTYNSFHSEGWFNWVNYENEEVDKLLEEARSVSDIEERKSLYREAQQIISDEAPMVFIKYPYFAIDGQAHSTRVKNFVPDPMQDMFFHEVWLEPETK